MEKNEEFYELSNIIDNCDSSYCDYVAEELTKEGYRKAKYVKTETAKAIFEELKAMCKTTQGYEYSFGNLLPVFAKVFAKYKVEVPDEGSN